MRVSRSSAACARLVFALLIAGAWFSLPAAGPRTSFALGTVAATQNLSNTNNSYTERPSIDGYNDRVTSVWTEREEGNPDGKDGGKLAHTTTIAGNSFPNATVRTTEAWSKYQWGDVEIDSTNGDSHIVYSVGDTVNYRRITLDGRQSTVKIANSNLPNAAKIARSKNGLLWVVWRDGSGSKIEYRFSTNNGDSWTNGNGSGVVASGSGTHNWPFVVIDNNDVAHVFYSKLGTGAANGEVRYADWNGAGFNTGDVTSDGSFPLDADASAALDGNNVIHLAWRKQVARGSSEIWQIVHAQRPAAGGTWAGYEVLASISGDAARAPGIDTDEANNVYVSFSEPTGRGVRRPALSTLINGKVERGPDLPYKRYVSATALAITSQGGVQAHIVYQDDLSNTNAEVYYARVSLGPVGPSATPNIIPTTTNQRAVNVAFEAQSGGPEQVRWRWNAAPTDAENDSNGWQTLPVSQLSINLPSSLSTSACGVQTLYTQVRNANATQATPKTDTVLYDAAAQATVRITNPYLRGLPKTFTPKVADTYTKPTDGAYNGDERYTRIPQYFVGIYNNGDCSGLASFSIPVSNASGPITNGTYENKLSLAQGSIPAPGVKTNVTVVVGDSVPNLSNYTNELIYDPADTNPSATVTNTLGLPVLNNGGSFSVQNVNSIIRELTFSGIDVDDTTYGNNENLSAGKQFWGVWIANSRSQVADPNTANLQWYPVPVLTPNASFKVSWNIFNGIPSANRTPGTYFIYVKFLDGAGNATIETLPVEQASLTEGFAVPTIYLPRISK